MEVGAQAEADQQMAQPDVGDDRVGAPQHAQMFDDILGIHLVSPQHEADNHAQREGGGERGDRTLRNEALELLPLLFDGFAELGEPALI
ncbi:hypothetical protein HZZ16_12355 [Bradyrhizobium sp. CNPSo 4016]|nr:hypothetical protein [Bradyrhizobium glycinis]